MARDDEMMTPADDASDALVPSWTAEGHLDEGTIHAWLDGAFGAEQASLVASHVGACAVCRESVAEARGFIAGASRMVRALDAVPTGVVPQSDVERVASRIVAAAVASTGPTPKEPIRARASRAWYTRTAMRSAAAVLVMVAGGSYLLSRDPDVAVSKMDRIAVDSAAPAMAPTPQGAAATGAASVAERMADQPRVQPLVERRDQRVVSPSAKKALPPTAPEPAPTVVAAADAMLADSARARFMKAETGNVAAMSMARAPAPPAAPSRSVGDTVGRIVTGRVTTASGTPVVGVSVWALSLATVGVLTDSSGAFRLKVAGDSVMLRARRLGFAPSTQAIDLRGRDSARVDLKMEPMVQQLNAVTVAGARGVPERNAVGISTSISGKSAESVRTAMTCWSVDAGDDVTGRLPTHLALPTPVGGRPIRTQWIDWPTTGRTTSVEMSSEGAERQFTGASIANGDTVTITISRRVDGWSGVVARRSATQRQQQILLTSASDGVCKL